MRFTLVDGDGTSSFCGPGHILKALAASCATGADRQKAVLAALSTFDATFTAEVSAGFAVFDEHCLPEMPAATDLWMTRRNAEHIHPFRAITDATRNASLEPRRLGLVIFNIPARRIVQVQNSYASLLRDDRGRVRQAGRPINRFYRYLLPDEWAIVP